MRKSIAIVPGYQFLIWIIQNYTVRPAESNRFVTEFSPWSKDHTEERLLESMFGTFDQQGLTSLLK